MNSRSDILKRIRSHQPPAAPLPDWQGPFVSYADCERQFGEVLASVGGVAVIVDSQQDLAEVVRGLPCFADARQIVCGCPELPIGNCELDAIADPHELADIDVAIMPGQFAVAENGAVWVTDRGVRHRAIYCITQHLVLVVPRRELVPHMHAAYERLSFPEAGYGLFISGPSKTADIEQSLVIGAHGARSLTVLLHGD